MVLTAHPEAPDVIGRVRAGTLVAPELLPKLVATARAAFEAELAKQRAVLEGKISPSRVAWLNVVDSPRESPCEQHRQDEDRDEPFRAR